MGSTQAMGFAEAVEDGQIDLSLALHYHFTANHFPPVSTLAIEPAQEAIEKASEGGWDELIDISDVARHVKYGTKVPVHVLIEGWHLYPFVADKEE